MISKFKVNNPDANPLHPQQVTVYVLECARSGALWLTRAEEQATNFAKLSKSDLAEAAVKRLIRTYGVSKLLKGPEEAPATSAAAESEMLAA